METKDEELSNIPAHDPQSHPWLLICHGKLQQKQLLYSVSEKRCYKTNIPQMRNKRVRSSNFGWLLLDDYKLMNTYLLNTSTMEMLHLPEIKFYYRHCLFSSVPGDPACHVMFVCIHNDVRFCKLGDDKLVKQGLNKDGTDLLAAIAFNGRTYEIAGDRALREVEFRETALYFVPVIEGLELEGPASVYCNSYLVESLGELLLVCQDYVGVVDEQNRETFDIKVYRADFARRKWVNMEMLGDRAIFLCQHEGKSCSASQTNIKGNCIYFVEPNDRNLYVFDMEDRSISVSIPSSMVDTNNLVLHWV